MKDLRRQSEREEKEHREGKIARERKSESTVSREDEEATGTRASHRGGSTRADNSRLP